MDWWSIPVGLGLFALIVFLGRWERVDDTSTERHKTSRRRKET